SPLSGESSQPHSFSAAEAPSSRTNMAKTKREILMSFMKGNLLTILTVIGVFGGVVVGVIMRNSREEGWTKREIMYVSYVGDIFLQMLKSLILPLIVASIITAIGGLDLSLSGKIGARAIAYYFITTVSAVILGMILVSIIHPGEGDVSSIHKSGTSRNVTTVDTLLDLIRNMFPPNLVQACTAQYQTQLIPPSDTEIIGLFVWPAVKQLLKNITLKDITKQSIVNLINLTAVNNSGCLVLPMFYILL
ncbi:hypothetical protein L9F63_022956, partial [Diploptera punctata]